MDERPRWYTDNMKSYGSAKNTVEHEMMERMKKRPKREEHDTSPAAIRRYRAEMGFGPDVTDADIAEMLDPFSEDDEAEYDFDDEDELEDDELESDDE